MYRSSTLGRSSKPPGHNISGRTDEDDITRKESWEDESFVRDGMPNEQSCERRLTRLFYVHSVKSSLPVVKHAKHNEQIAADNKADRMSMWIRNVEGS